MDLDSFLVSLYVLVDDWWHQGGNDILYALGGHDNLLSVEGKDWVLGGNERRASGGDKILMGEPGNDRHWGGIGSDTVLGGTGNDFVQTSNKLRAARNRCYKLDVIKPLLETFWLQ